MEGKKLNLNQPFLSVRRHPPQGVAASLTGDEKRGHTSPIPYYKSELKSGPVGKKGAVPFHWEQTPGKPREGARDTFDNKAHESSPDNLLVDYEDCEPVKEKHEEKWSLETEDDEDEVYEDALDRLSQTNSTFLNCSLSGVSGFGDDYSHTKPCLNFSRDPNSLSLVMGRFLPAAKAMVTEAPRYSPKKPIVNREESREVKKIGFKKEGNGKPLLLRYGPSFANRYSNYYYNVGQETGEEDEEEEESSEDDDCRHGALLPPVCGLLPRFCFKGSSGILNPVPGSKSRGDKAGKRSIPVRNDLKIESCSVREIGKFEAFTGSESGERGLKTFGEFLEDKEESPEKELVDSLDENRAVDIPPEDLKNLELVGCNKRSSSTAADDKEIDPKESGFFGDQKFSEFVNISPPLPKSPSDSWLGRTLPSVSSKSVHHRNPKLPVTVSRWEAIVKSSKLQHHNSRYPEEVLTPLQKT